MSELDRISDSDAAITENPKMVGSGMIDCIPQHGPCPNDCDQCYYNWDFYRGHEPFVPSEAEAEGKIVRVNSGHDSNIHKGIVLAQTRHFKHRFYNTSIPDLDFENAPVVLTVNPKQDDYWIALDEMAVNNLMFVRFRANPWNVDMAMDVVRHYRRFDVPVVMTFMRYFEVDKVRNIKRYEKRTHIQHEYWDITLEAWESVMNSVTIGRHVYSCGTPENPYCRDCGVCETMYYRLLKNEGRYEEIEKGLKNERIHS